MVTPFHCVQVTMSDRKLKQIMLKTVVLKCPLYPRYGIDDSPDPCFLLTLVALISPFLTHSCYRKLLVRTNEFKHVKPTFKGKATRFNVRHFY